MSYILIPQKVVVRKYDVDVDKLQKLLRDHKKKVRMSNKQIAERLGVPLTMAEHWFRADKYFSIPDSDIWMDLKNLLGIETDSMDISIMTFEEREGTFDKAERCYLTNDIGPTLLAEDGCGVKIIV